MTIRTASLKAKCCRGTIAVIRLLSWSFSVWSLSVCHRNNSSQHSSVRFNDAKLIHLLGIQCKHMPFCRGLDSDRTCLDVTMAQGCGSIEEVNIPGEVLNISIPATTSS